MKRFQDVYKWVSPRTNYDIHNTRSFFFFIDPTHVDGYNEKFCVVVEGGYGILNLYGLSPYHCNQKAIPICITYGKFAKKFF